MVGVTARGRTSESREIVRNRRGPDLQEASREASYLYSRAAAPPMQSRLNGVVKGEPLAVLNVLDR